MNTVFLRTCSGQPWSCCVVLQPQAGDGDHLTKELLTQQMQSSLVPGLAAVKARIEAELRQRIGGDVDLDSIPDLVHLGYVDDYYASFEWSDGGLLHAHMAFWIVGSPRIYKIAVPKEHGDHVVEISAGCDTDVVLPEVEAASRMASFWDRVVTEYNVAKALKRG